MTMTRMRVRLSRRLFKLATKVRPTRSTGNTAVGYNALGANTSAGNTAIGVYSIEPTSSS